jgi:hypothetical protein
MTKRWPSLGLPIMPHWRSRTRRHARSQDLLFSRPEELLNSPSISLSGNLHPQISSSDPPLFTYRGIGTRDFTSLMVERCTLESPRPDASVNTDSLSIRTFLIAISLLAISNTLIPRLSIPDVPKL